MSGVGRRRNERFRTVVEPSLECSSGPWMPRLSTSQLSWACIRGVMSVVRIPLTVVLCTRASSLEARDVRRKANGDHPCSQVRDLRPIRAVIPSGREEMDPCGGEGVGEGGDLVGLQGRGQRSCGNHWLIPALELGSVALTAVASGGRTCRRRPRQ